MFVPDTNSVSEARMTFVSEGTEYDEEIPNVTEATDEPPKMSFSIGFVEIDCACAKIRCECF